MGKVFDTEKKIRLGIWGLGRGRAFIEQCRELNIEITAACDLDAAAREDFRKVCPDAFITDNEDEFLRQDTDVVLVATYFFAHAKDSIKALNAGKHVISEVSAFFTPAEGVALVEAVEKSGKLYCLAENYTDQFVKKLWREGVFGELSYAEFDYVHECRGLCYSYLYGDPIIPGNTAHSWRSWLNFHYYCTHSLGAAMEITGNRPVQVIAPESSKTLPGYLPGSEMGAMKPSFVVMDNGGVIRNLTGSGTSNSHVRKIWGSRAFVDLTEEEPSVVLGQAGDGIKVKLNRSEDELTRLAQKAGHGGGDFWMLYYFANAFFNGTPLYWDIYAACDVTLTGIMAVKSQYANGTPMEVPDFRDRSVREKYRSDNFAQTHFDPRKIFPDNQNVKETSKFSLIMNDLHRAWSSNGVPLLISALDGIKLYPYMKDSESRLKVQKQVRQLLRDLSVIAGALKQARALAEKYPDSLAAGALLSFCESAEPERMADVPKLRQELTGWLLTADLPVRHQLKMTIDEKTLNESKVPEIPEGFILRTFKSGDEENYMNLMRHAGFEYWDEKLVERVKENALEDGIFFLVEKSTGRLAATAMANRLNPENNVYGAELGWVGAEPEFRGKHLATIACLAVQERFSREGYKKACLNTDDFRLPALKTYISLGWLPVLMDKEYEKRWDRVYKKLGMQLPLSLENENKQSDSNKIFTIQ